MTTPDPERPEDVLAPALQLVADGRNPGGAWPSDAVAILAVLAARGYTLSKSAPDRLALAGGAGDEACVGDPSHQYHSHDDDAEPALREAMHVAAVEAARSFGRQDAEREALSLIARLVEAAGGEIRLSRNAMVDDPPELLWSQDPMDPLTRPDVYRTRRRTQVALRAALAREPVPPE